MAETINTNVFDSNKKFVDFSGLDYFWGKAKTYIDGVDASLSAKVVANEKAIAAINGELDSLSGGAGSIQTQISNAIAALDLPNTYEAKGSADAALVDAKAYVDGKVDGKFDAAGAAAQALTDAKAYADGLASDYDAAGSAAQALADAKTYVDGKDSAMDTRVKALEGINHDQLAADAASSAVATILDGAPGKFDTLKEVADWIASSESADSAADLVTRVSALEAIDHEAYVAADTQVLADAKSYVDGKVDGKFDTEGSAAQALADAKSYVDGKVDGKFDAVGAAATAKSEAIADADAKLALKANSADVYAKGTVDTMVSDAQAAAIAQAKADAADALKAYYTKTEVDNLLSTNSEGDRAYAKQYTDELFGSIKFAANSDIDALFAPKA
jgi:hypothetical protein